MERGIITMNEYGRVTIPTSTNVWMTEAELSSLLGTIAPTLRAAIRAVYKSGVLKRHEAERYIRLPDGYGMEVYALPMVVQLHSASIPHAREGYAKPCWKGCTGKKKDKSCGCQ